MRTAARHAAVEAGVSARGFSLVELLVALAVTLLSAGALVAVLEPANGAFQAQPEAADVQQRLRVVSDLLSADLAAAGSGPAVVRGGSDDPQPAPAIFPFRVGRRLPDAVGTFDASRVAVWWVAAAAPQAMLATPLASASGAASIEPGPGCPAGDASCGFRAGMLAGVIGPGGAWDLFSITAVNGTTLTLQHNLRDSVRVHPAHATAVAEMTVRTYFTRDDRTVGFPQLMRYDGAAGADAPVVDHVAAFVVEYVGEAAPPAIVPGQTGEPDRVTYGPVPPPANVAVGGYPPGENCVFARTDDGAVVSRLASMGASPFLVPLPAQALTDGPWCPDALDPNRYDADLLRVRQLNILVTIEAALAALRGPAGLLFTRAGTARGSRVVPDRQIRLVVTPRALNARR